MTTHAHMITHAHMTTHAHMITHAHTHTHRHMITHAHTCDGVPRGDAPPQPLHAHACLEAQQGPQQHAAHPKANCAHALCVLVRLGVCVGVGVGVGGACACVLCMQPEGVPHLASHPMQRTSGGWAHERTHKHTYTHTKNSRSTHEYCTPSISAACRSPSARLARCPSHHPKPAREGQGGSEGLGRVCVCVCVFENIHRESRGLCAERPPEIVCPQREPWSLWTHNLWGALSKVRHG